MTLRIILVGLGARAQFWMRVIRENPDCTIVGLIDPSEAARERAKAQWPDAAASADLSLVGQVEAVMGLQGGDRQCTDHQAGSCWLMQWNDPPPVRIARDDRPITGRSGNRPDRASTARAPGSSS